MEKSGHQPIRDAEKTMPETEIRATILRATKGFRETVRVTTRAKDVVDKRIAATNQKIYSGLIELKPDNNAIIIHSETKLEKSYEIKISDIHDIKIVS